MPPPSAGVELPRPFVREPQPGLGISRPVSAESLSTVVSAPTDLDVLLEILLRPEARLPSRDPFTAARLRGAQASRRLLDAEGGTLSAEEVGEILGITRQAVNQRAARPTARGAGRWGARGRPLLRGAWRRLRARPALTRSLRRTWPRAGSRSPPAGGDGLLYRARHDPARVAVAVFERARRTLSAHFLGTFASRRLGPYVGKILDHYGFGWVEP